MKRGDLVIVATSGDGGKPYPAMVVQAEPFDLHPTVIILPLTLDLHDAPLFRVTVRAGGRTGLLRDSQIMVDKATTVPRARIGTRVGKVDPPTLQAVDESLRGFLGL